MKNSDNSNQENQALPVKMAVDEPGQAPKIPENASGKPSERPGGLAIVPAEKSVPSGPEPPKNPIEDDLATRLRGAGRRKPRSNRSYRIGLDGRPKEIIMGGKEPLPPPSGFLPESAHDNDRAMYHPTPMAANPIYHPEKRPQPPEPQSPRLPNADPGKQSDSEFYRLLIFRS